MTAEYHVSWFMFHVLLGSYFTPYVFICSHMTFTFCSEHLSTFHVLLCSRLMFSYQWEGDLPVIV